MAKLFSDDINSRFKLMLIYSFITSIITAICGLILLLAPIKAFRLIGIISGIIFLISGVSCIYKYFHRDGAKLYSLNLIFGILFSLLGAVIIVYPFKAMAFVTTCLGLYLIVSGATKISYAVWLKIGSEESWLITLVTGIILIIFGILVIYNPFIQLKLAQLVGVFLLITGILDFSDTLLYRKRAKEITDIFW